MTPTKTPHPLAVEAMTEIDAEGYTLWGFQERDKAASIIHTTALEPVIKGGEDVLKFIRHDDDCLWFTSLGGVRLCSCGKDAALTQWRTLTSPKTGDSTPQEASRSDFQPLDGSK